jgi:hypothetical protein
MAADRSSVERARIQLADAVEATIGAVTARVVITMESRMHDWPGESAINDSPPFEGVVDFGADRCRLASGDAQMVMDGGATYQRLDDGRWQRDAGRPGEWSSLHPRWPLETIRRTTTDASLLETRAGGASFEIALDRDRAGAFTYAGLAPEWRMTGRVVVDSAGRIKSVHIALRSQDDDGLDTRYELAEFGIAADIELPPLERVVSQTAYLAEHGFSLD